MRPQPDPTVVAVVLSYNAIEALLGTIDAIVAQRVPVRAIYVADNGSSDGTRDSLSALRGAVRPLLSPVNLGVGAGHNAGWRAALEDAPDTAFIWALEHDSVPPPGCLQRLLSTFQRFDAAGARPAVVVPRQWHPDPDEPMNGRSTPIRDPYIAPKMTFNAALISVEAILATGWLREDFFVGHEDREYAWRLTEKGYSVVHDPSAVVVHRNKGARRREGRSVLRDYYSARNELYLRRRIRREPFAVTKMTTRSVFHVSRVLVRGDRRSDRISARVVAIRDAVRGELGPKSYRFLDAERSP
jgi:GT2 family glycosyltransferase